MTDSKSNQISQKNFTFHSPHFCLIEKFKPKNEQLRSHVDKLKFCACIFGHLENVEVIYKNEQLRSHIDKLKFCHIQIKKKNI